jgi:adenosine deaminase
MSFEHLSKVELHLHLDCSQSYTVVTQIDPSITPADYQNNFIPPTKCTDLADVLTRAASGVRIMQTEDQLRLVTQDLFAQLVQDNVLYVEIRFAPLLHTERSLAAQDVVRVVEETTSECIETTGIEARILLCTLRNFSEAQSLETVALVEQFRGTCVAGFDIAADEAGDPIDAHVKAFQYAREHCIPCTAHAGEAKGPESVWETLQHLHPVRIGHGVRCIEDPALMDHLRRNGIHLEVCPTSNVMTDIYPDYESHPVDKLYRAGLSVGINADAHTLINTTLNQEYEKLNRVFGWEKEQFLDCNVNALRAAFIPEQTRIELMGRLMDGYGGLNLDESRVVGRD